MIEVSEREYVQLAEALFTMREANETLHEIATDLNIIADAAQPSNEQESRLRSATLRLLASRLRGALFANKIIMDAARREAAERSVEYDGSTSTETGEGDAGRSEHQLAGEPRG